MFWWLRCAFGIELHVRLATPPSVLRGGTKCPTQYQYHCPKPPISPMSLTRSPLSGLIIPSLHQARADKQPAEALAEEHPQISQYLLSLDPSNPHPQPPSAITETEEDGPISALAVENYTSTQTTNLLEETKRIMEESERDGTDPDERLREVVERAVREGFNFGGVLGGVAGVAESIEVDGGGKRSREDGA
jgi:hypothetical protein